jgi:hypothetical protein
MQAKLSVEEQLKLYRSKHAVKKQELDKKEEKKNIGGKLESKYGWRLNLTKEQISAEKIINFIRNKLLITPLNLNNKESQNIQGIYKYRLKLSDDNLVKNNDDYGYLDYFVSTGDKNIDDVLLQSLK